MQYWPFLAMPGLRFVSRYQLAFAILMFLGSPAWIGLFLLGSVMVALSPSAAALIRPDAGVALLACVLAMWIAPQTATAIDILMRREARQSYGGTPRFLASFAVAMVFWILLSAIMWLSHTLFLAGLPFGRKLGWIGQIRDDHAVPLALAVRSFWRHTVVGLAVIALLAATHPAALPYALLIAGGLVLSIPIAAVTSWPGLGRFMTEVGLGRLPEETDPPPDLQRLDIAAVRGEAATPAPTPARAG
jgi:membrane glycosyltransferase